MTGPQVFRVLTVCLGNVCRSPLMERLLRDRLPDGFVVESAGLTAMVGRPMEANAAGELARLNGSPEGFVARNFEVRLADSADLVLAATEAVRAGVLSESPRSLRRTFTLLELAHLLESVPDGLEDAGAVVAWAAAHRSMAAGVTIDLPDPMGRSAETHRAVADRIDTATRVVADALASAATTART